jgi:protein TonB
MDSYVDREMERQIVRVTRKEVHHGLGDHFSGMLILSLVLHICFAIYLAAPGGGRSHPSVVTVNLADISLPDRSSQLPEPAAKTPEQQPAASEPLPAPPLPESQQLAKAMDNALTQATQQPDLLHESSLGLGLTRGYFNSLAEGKTLRGDIRVYYFDMLRRLNEVWWAHGVQGMSPGKREALVDLEISRDGILLRRDLLRSTGDRQLDRAILAAIDGASPFPPLPGSYTEPTFSAPLRLAAPLSLFSLTDGSP